MRVKYNPTERIMMQDTNELSTYKQELIEWAEENKRVMAHIVGTKRVETKWLDLDEFINHIKGEGKL